MSLARRDPDDGGRALAATLPGLYDLLPRFRCVDDGADGRPLPAADVVALGGDGTVRVIDPVARQLVTNPVRAHARQTLALTTIDGANSRPILVTGGWTAPYASGTR